MKQAYPPLVGTEYENCLFTRWELQFENISHEVREDLVEKLNKKSLSFHELPFSELMLNNKTSL